MASSVLAYLKKVQDGTIFSEGFENQNWLSAENWTTIQGTPTVSLGNPNSGQYAFQCTGTGATLSQISTFLSTGAYLMYAYFFDDGTTTSGTGPYVKFEFSDGKYISIGVNNTVTSANYCYGALNVSTDNPTTNSGVSRSVGWHKLLVWTDGPNKYIYIDASSPYNVNSNFSTGTTIFIMSGASSYTGSTFGLFDDVAAFTSANISFLNLSTRTLNLYNSSNTLQSNQAASGDEVITNISILSLFPWPVYIELSDPLNVHYVEFRSRLLNVNPGDIYIYFPVNFSQKIAQWDPLENLLINQNQSDSGVTETLFKGFKPRHTFLLTQNNNSDLYKSLKEFFGDCGQGECFSMMIDNKVGNGIGIISYSPGIGAKTVTVMPNLSTNPTDNFVVGRVYRIFNSAGNYRQKVTLASKNSTTLTFNEYIKYPFLGKDCICDDSFVPFLELGTNPEGLKYTNYANKYFNWSQMCQEFTGW